MVIDALMDVANVNSRRLVFRAVGVIDMTGTVGRGVEKCGTHVEKPGDFPQVMHAVEKNRVLTQ